MIRFRARVICSRFTGAFGIKRLNKLALASNKLKVGSIILSDAAQVRGVPLREGDKGFTYKCRAAGGASNRGLLFHRPRALCHPRSCYHCYRALRRRRDLPAPPLN